MSPDFQSLYRSLKHWAETATASGWLSPQTAEALDAIEQQQVSELFRKTPHRPLIVGLFGGTGVGKSSLLNRLAGEEIARVGVERPTSHEVTLYLHKDFKLDLLPPDLPMSNTRIAYHGKPERRLIAWLDMPDIDSTATENQQIVRSWLPYVDWIIYVVSPERYYDDIGWRFLQDRAGRHAWVFVMNHWDQGREEQIEDLRRRLQAEGFKDPLILRTIGIPNGQPDDFDRLEQIINDAINNYGLDILQQLGIQARNRDLRQLAEDFAAELGEDSGWEQAARDWRNTVGDQLEQIANNLETQTEAQTQGFLARQTVQKRSLLARLREPEETTPAIADTDKLVQSLWDSRNQARLDALNEQLMNELQEKRLPWRACEKPLEALRRKAVITMEQALTDGITAAMLKPGNALQRALYRITGTLTWLLPTAAAIWAVYHLVTTFYLGTHGEARFLGVNFLLHAGMLIALGALIPWLLHIKVKPSIADTVRRGLKTGIDTGIARLRQQYEETWRTCLSNRKRQLETLEKLEQEIARLEAEPLQELGGLMQSSDKS